MELPYLLSEEMAEVDRKAPEKYGVTVSRMMENAGYQIADFIRSKYDEDTEIGFYIGKGNNGGDGLAAARRLHNWGFNISLELITENLEGIRAEELKILRKLDADFVEELDNADVAVDCLIGYNLDGKPRSPFDKSIERINKADEIVSVDIPTGIDADTGEAFQNHVRADKILTLAMPKNGLKPLDVDTWVADISVPTKIYRELGYNVSELFQQSSRVYLD